MCLCSYSLEQTEQFLHALLDDGPVRNVVASEPALQRNGTSRPQSKERVSSLHVTIEHCEMKQS